MEQFLERLGYLGVFLAAALDGVFPIVPGESTVVAAAVLAAAGHLTLWIVIAAGALGAIVGDSAAYGIGASGQGRFREGMVRRLGGNRIAAAQDLLNRRGMVLIIFGRFVPASARSRASRLVSSDTATRVSSLPRRSRASSGQRARASSAISSAMQLATFGSRSASPSSPRSSSRPSCLSSSARVSAVCSTGDRARLRPTGERGSSIGAPEFRRIIPARLCGSWPHAYGRCTDLDGLAWREWGCAVLLLVLGRDGAATAVLSLALWMLLWLARHGADGGAAAATLRVDSVERRTRVPSAGDTSAWHCSPVRRILT